MSEKSGEIKTKDFFTDTVIQEVAQRFDESLERFFGSYRNNFRAARYPESAKNAIMILEELFHRYDKDRLSEKMISFKKREKFLYVDKNYRDHFLHQFNVFLLGKYILDNDKIQKPKLNEFEWLLCSALHDVGYPVSLANMWLREFGFSPVSRKNRSLILKNLASLCLAYQKKREEKWMWEENVEAYNQPLYKKWEGWIKNPDRCLDHAPISAIITIGSILDSHRSKDKNYMEGRFSKEVCPAALAVAIHHIRDEKLLGEKVSCRRMPNSFLLMLCDEIQDWGRPLLINSERRVPRKRQCKLRDIDCSGGKLVIDLDYPKNEQAIRDKLYNLKELERVLSPDMFEILIKLNKEEFKLSTLVPRRQTLQGYAFA